MQNLLSFVFAWIAPLTNTVSQGTVKVLMLCKPFFKCEKIQNMDMYFHLEILYCGRQ